VDERAYDLILQPEVVEDEFVPRPNGSNMNLYTFDVRLFASITIEADNPATARNKLNEQLAAATLKLSDGDLVGVSQDDGDQDLVEINGDPA
jgi:hypothetical protein